MNTLAADEADLERRFGGLRRLYGDAGYARLRTARVGVVGVGGVGSWAVEALARCGVAELLLFDLDHVAESNINRQVQASSGTLGQAKVQALAERIAGIHPGCRVQGIEEFVQPDNWPALLPQAVDVFIDACDQSSAKLTLARWALDSGAALVCVGAAGGKRRADAVTVADLAEATHDPLLASLRQRLRKAGAGPKTGRQGQGRFGLRCVFSREPVQKPPMPTAACEIGQPAAAPGSPLACAGYGSTVMVTAAFGMAAAAEAVALLLQASG